MVADPVSTPPRATLCDVDPKRYLKEAAIAAIRDREILLPHQLRS